MNNIVSVTRSWLGTAFVHQGRRKASGSDRGGVDCLGLLIGVAAECGLQQEGVALASLDQRDYGHYPDEKRLDDALARHLMRVNTQDMQAGDVLLMRIDGTARHLGIVGEYPIVRPAVMDSGNLTIIHAYAPARKVVEHRLDAEWLKKVVGVFRFDDAMMRISMRR